jgi:uncharacterized protein (TIGR02266 family)
MTDRRRHPRIPVRQRVWCEGERLTLYVQALDVSLGGMFVRTSHPPSPGERFRVSFTDFGEGEVVAAAEVVWAAREGDGKTGMGLRFVAFERGAADYERFVARCAIESKG